MTTDVAAATPAVPDAGSVTGPATEPTTGFAVRLDNFEGPFDLLLSLISKHKLDITEVALSQVTDEFIAFIRSRQARSPEAEARSPEAEARSPEAEARSPEAEGWDLDQTSSFLVVAATLLDLKAARLLPQGDVEDEDDLALLEARDLLFARLMQYRAFKEVAGMLERRMSEEAMRYPRAVSLEERFATLLPDVLIGLGLDEFAALAGRALQPKPVAELSLAHLHAPRVSVKEQASIVIDRLRRLKTMTFRALAGDSPDTLTTVARFLALLELFRENAVAFDQISPLGELTVRWTGSDEGDVAIHDEFEGAPPDAPGPQVQPADTTIESAPSQEDAG